MPDQSDSLRSEIELEVARALAGADPVGDDEPERDAYLTRLLSLREAVVESEPEGG